MLTGQDEVDRLVPRERLRMTKEVEGSQPPVDAIQT